MNDVILNITPILIMTSALMVVAFLPIPIKKRQMAIIVTFILWLSITGITWVTLLR